MNRRAIVIGTAAVAVAALGGGAYWYDRSSKRAAEEAATAASGMFVRPNSPVIGPPNAPVTIVEFLDPACEACRAFYPVVKQILGMFPNDVRLVVRYAAFHKGSDEAVRILETARGQGRLEPVMEALFREQPRWAAHGAPDIALAWQIAARAGLNLDRAQTEARALGVDAFLRQEAADVKQANVRQTPTFFVNGKPLPSFGPDQLLNLVRSEVEAGKAVKAK